MDKQLLIALFGPLASVIVALVQRRKEKGPSEPGEPPKPIPRPNLVFVSYLAAGIGITALLLLLFKPQHVESLGATPVGSIVAYPGRVVSDDDLPGGWMLCDGRKIPGGEKFGKLRQVLGQSAWTSGSSAFLPDLRGVFLRGVDDPDGVGGEPGAGRDLDAATRYELHSRQAVGDIVGSFEDGATAHPIVPFKTDEAGQHTHDIIASPSNGSSAGAPFGDGDGRPGGTVARHTEPAGLHSHLVKEGGDKETRPINASVNYIIKAWQP